MARAALFFNGAYVDLVDDWGAEFAEAEGINVRQSLLSLGHQVRAYTATDAAGVADALAGMDVAVFPYTEIAGYTPSQEVEDVYADFVASGGTMVVHGNYRSIDLLNSIFEFSLQRVSGTSSSPSTKTALGAADPSFDAAPSYLVGQGSMHPIIGQTLPAGSKIHYSVGGGTHGGSAATIVEIPYGAGAIVYIAWDWFNAAPEGSKDAGWLAAYQGAIAAALPADAAGANLATANGETIVGTAGDEAIWGLGGGDVIYGGGGDDTIDGNGGHDDIMGEAGDDTLRISGTDADSADGGAGHDTLVLDFGDDGTGITRYPNLGGHSVLGGHEGGYLDGTGRFIGYAEIERFVITTGTGSDMLDTGDGDDVLSTGDGDDRAIAHAGDDLIDGGAGNDRLEGGAGDDILRGGSGNDRLDAGEGADALDGGPGNDVLFYGAALDAGDVNQGGDGADTLVLQGDYPALVLGAVSLLGIEGVSLQSGTITRWGQAGTSSYDYSVTMAEPNAAPGQQLRVNAQSLQPGEDLIFNGSAEGDGGRFLVYAGFGIDHLTGGAGNDVFFFEAGRLGAGDRMIGGGGNDAVVISGAPAGTTGPVNVAIGAGTLTGIEALSFNGRFASDPSSRPSYQASLADGNIAPGATLIVNASSLDAAQAFGFDGAAVADGRLSIFGGAGADTLTGGANADLISGGLGADLLRGSGGADIFQYRDAAESDSVSYKFDTIEDFVHGVDKIDLSRIDARPGTAGDDAFDFVGAGQPGAGGGSLSVFQVNAARWIVSSDVDGDNMIDLRIDVWVEAGQPLTASDFIL